MSIGLKVLWQTCILLLAIKALVLAEQFPEEIETDEMENEAESQPGSVKLLVGLGSAIIQTLGTTDAPVKEVINISNQEATGIDFDCKQQRIVWSDMQGHTIRSAFLNGTDLKDMLASANSPMGIAIDWSSRNAYYINWNERSIGVVSLDGKYQTMLTGDQIVCHTHALALDMENRYLFFGKFARTDPLAHVIGRVDLDGSNMIDFIDANISRLNALAVLSRRRELCWVDDRLHQLSCIGLDGQNRRVVFENDDLNSLHAWTHNYERFYWSSLSDGNIYSVSISGEDYTSFFLSDSEDLHGIVAVNEGCDRVETECAVNSGGCSHLCLPKTGGGVTCVCPDNVNNSDDCENGEIESDSPTLLITTKTSIFKTFGIADAPVKEVKNLTDQYAHSIDYDCKQKRVIWTDFSDNAIRTSFLNGTDQKEIFADANRRPAALAIDWSSRNVYFVNLNDKKIGVVNLNGKYQKMITSEGIVSKPQALALDLQNRHVFFAKYSQTDPELSVIGRMDMDGSSLVEFVDRNVSVPEVLAVLRTRNELCWVDSRLRELSCIGLDHENRRLLFAHDSLHSLKDWTVFNDERFYWTSWGNGKLYSVTITGDGNRSFLLRKAGTTSFNGIVALTEECYGAEMECAVNNGECPYLCLPKTGGGVTCVCPDNVKELDGCEYGF